MKLGIVGWRGMVGQVLMDRMLLENDLNHFETTFFSTSNANGDHPFSKMPNVDPLLKDAYNLDDLKTMDIILTCQGGDYTKEVFKKLRAKMMTFFGVALDPINIIM